MDSRMFMMNFLLQHQLKLLCSSGPSKWAYAVFWRTIPRIWTTFEQNKGNKRNWILVWEDGFCDFFECVSLNKGKFDHQMFFKMAHEVYSFGEGLVGKVAASNAHKWVVRRTQNGKDSYCMSSWNISVESHPKAWKSQFISGIQTIAVISVREGAIQLGSFYKIEEDVDWVNDVQRRFNYIHCVQRPSHLLLPFCGQTQVKLSAEQENEELLSVALRTKFDGGLVWTAPFGSDIGQSLSVVRSASDSDFLGYGFYTDTK